MCLCNVICCELGIHSWHLRSLTVRSTRYSRSSLKHPSPSKLPASRPLRKRKAIRLTMAMMMFWRTISEHPPPKTTMTMTRRTRRRIRHRNLPQLLKHLQRSKRRKWRLGRPGKKRKRAKNPLPQHQKRIKKMPQQLNPIHKNQRRTNSRRFLLLSLVSCAKIPRSLPHLRKPSETSCLIWTNTWMIQMMH